MNMPDFAEWANSVIQNSIDTGDAHYLIGEALKQAFEQGYSLGKRAGYEDGRDNAWWKEQEKDD